MDEYGNEYPIVVHYYHVLDYCEYYAEGTMMLGYESIREFVKGNQEEGITAITNPFKLKF